MEARKIFTNRHIILFLMVGFIVFMLFFDRNNYIDTQKLNRRIEELEAECQYYRDRIAADSAIIEGLNDNAFLEKFARENFLMQRDGEEVYLINEGK